MFFLRYIHGDLDERSLSALRNVFLKKAREWATQWRSILHKGHVPIQERENQTRETMLLLIFKFFVFYGLRSLSTFFS